MIENNIKKCTCKHEFQDEKYGKGYRVHNPINNEANINNWRCTVCKQER